ncbi:hypothetical protein MVES1_000980 [Malassezia vespertilionis]|uniref:uncharacterized protein n=1 Tax=Malassezia vespertilionis TaxID=2020962 RepID=UPI0024B1B1EF|nr:uncharacterized protein MVES1_000980 [Malassezia vespertilionis]WFD05648.1 hypothetical protein MVES1_000980 [Malassezia vespertilionis]
MPNEAEKEVTRGYDEEHAHIREERDMYEEKYNGLLAKLTQMRNTLGERLRDDAEELDRREQQIEKLTAQIDECHVTNSTLQEELVTSHADTDRMSSEIDTLRAHIAENTASVGSEKLNLVESRCRELQQTMDAQRVDLDRWENAYLDERSRKEELESRIVALEKAMRDAESREEQHSYFIEQEKLVARQLQQALEDLQITHEQDAHRAVENMQEELDKTEAELETYKIRLHDTEVQLHGTREAAGKCAALEQEVKEKNIFIGKLRHEAVILNEHLTDALRKIRQDSPESVVDKRLVTNLLLQFLTLPRADSKRFEVLGLIGTVLQWDDEEREKAGLKKSNEGSKGFGFLGLGALRSNTQSTEQASDEPVSNLFVEFLLTEVERGRGGNPSASKDIKQGAKSDQFDLRRLGELERADTPACHSEAEKLDAEIFLIRHGEKDPDGAIGLNPTGEQRAECVTKLFSRGDLKVDYIIVQDYKSNGKRIRPYMTVKGLGKKLNINVDHHCDRDDEDCALDSIKKAVSKGAKRVLVCWEHDALSDIAELLGVDGLKYPSDRFDLVYQVYQGKLEKVFSEDCPKLDK